MKVTACYCQATCRHSSSPLQWCIIFTKNDLQPAVIFKWHGLLTVMLKYDTTHPHTAHATVETCIFNIFRICHIHQTLVLGDNHTFGLWHEAVGGKTFRSEEEVQQTVHEWLRSPQEYFFFYVGIHELCQCFRTCIKM